ncbi:Arm DNA-binding domain-containing protein [Achromobacter xylosoxidans]|uniref:Arm DNA-binding domain-containing protein n=1 Tax=Alcaligenes xylosoxydans xylosoxydans TaxID=85698 RepID=UPI003D2ACD15
MGRKGTGVEIREKSIRISFTLDGAKKRETLKVNGTPMLPTPANVKYAERVAIEIREKIRHGTFSMAEYFPESVAEVDGTVGGQLDVWVASQRIENSTKDGYSSAIKFWKNGAADKHGLRLGLIPLRRLKLSHILTVIASRPDLTGKTVNNYVSVLRQALELAVQDKILTDNPAEGVPRAKHQKEPPDPFSLEEAEAIIAYAAEKYPEPVYNMIEAWFFTGLRTSEVFGTRWPNVDLRDKTAQIVEAIVRGERKSRTKTNTGRLVKLNSRSFAAFHRQEKHSRMRGEQVWLDPRYGTAWEDERAFRRSYWSPALKILGIRYRRPYNIRHTYATMMLMAGMRPAFCAKQMGHSIQVFLTTYAKWLDGAHDDLEMARLESAITPNVPRENKTGT